MRAPRILCVDDEENNVVLLEAVLLPLGYEVLQAGDGGQALAILHREPVDLVLLDVMMPGMDGYAVCRAIKSDPAIAAVPVVMITALSAKEDRIRSIEAGAEDFLSKPFDRIEVTARVQMLLKVKALDDRLRRSYAHITRLTTFGKQIVTRFDPLDFKLLAVMDQVVEQVLSRPGDGDDRPERVIVGIRAGADRWRWYAYAADAGAVARQTIPLDLRGWLRRTVGDQPRIAAVQNGEIDAPHLAELVDGLSRHAVRPHNILYYVSETTCVLCCNYRQDITPYDADALNAIVMQTVFLKTLHTQVEEIAMAFDYSLHALARASEVHDEDTGNHILRVGEYSALLARELGLPEAFIREIKLHAVTHDVGKMHIPLDLLLHPGPLDAGQFAVMQQHTIFGARILGDHLRLRMAKNIALHHHENWDGDGYPAGLAGEAIPLEARIVKLADQYDALRSKRPYKPPLDHQTTRHILTEGDRRTHPKMFDPAVLRAFRQAEAKFAAVYEQLQA